MPIAYDAASSGADTGTNTPDNTITISHNCSGSDRLLIVGVGIKTDANQTISSVTFDGSPMTLVPGSTATNGTNVLSALYYLIAPPTGAKNIVITTSAGTFITAGGISFTGADQTAPLGTANTATGESLSASVNVSSSASEIVADVVSGNSPFGDPFSFTSGKTMRWTANASGVAQGRNKGQGSTSVGAATTTMSYTASDTASWAISAVPLKEVQAGASTLPKQEAMSITRSW